MSGGGAKGEGGRSSSRLPTELDLTILRSGPELKLRVQCNRPSHPGASQYFPLLHIVTLLHYLIPTYLNIQLPWLKSILTETAMVAK